MKPASAAPVDPDKIRNLQMPLWLLGAGVGIEMVALFLRGDGVEAGLVDLAANLILGTTVMLVGIFLAARLRQIDLGNFWIAAFKLAAIVVAPAAAIDLVTPVLNIIPLGGLVGLAIDFILYFALLGALFELNESDTWYCVWVIFLVRLAMFFAMAGIQAKWG